jgi:hypothetical protein
MRRIHTGSQPLPPNTEVYSTFNLGETVSLFTEDYFPLKFYSSAQLSLSTRAIDDLKVGEGPSVEDIPNMIDKASISVGQIDEVEADETRRKQYNTIY